MKRYSIYTHSFELADNSQLVRSDYRKAITEFCKAVAVLPDIVDPDNRVISMTLNRERYQDILEVRVVKRIHKFLSLTEQEPEIVYDIKFNIGKCVEKGNNYLELDAWTIEYYDHVKQVLNQSKYNTPSEAGKKRVATVVHLEEEQLLNPKWLEARICKYMDECEADIKKIWNDAIKQKTIMTIDLPEVAVNVREIMHKYDPKIKVKLIVEMTESVLEITRTIMEKGMASTYYVTFRFVDGKWRLTAHSNTLFGFLDVVYDLDTRTSMQYEIAPEFFEQFIHHIGQEYKRERELSKKFKELSKKYIRPIGILG